MSSEFNSPSGAIVPVKQPPSPRSMSEDRREDIGVQLWPALWRGIFEGTRAALCIRAWE